MEKTTYIKIGVGAAVAVGGMAAGDSFAYADEPLPPPQPTEETVSTAPESEQETPQDNSYTVAGGETMYGIATRLGVEVEVVQALNPAIDPQTLHAGDTIIVPDPATTTEPVSVEPASTDSPAEQPVASTDKPSQVVEFSNGLTIVSPSGSGNVHSATETSFVSTAQAVQAVAPQQTATNTAEATFVNVPFQQSEVAYEAPGILPQNNTQNGQSQQSLVYADSAPNIYVPADETPIQITTNAAAVVSIDSTGIKVEVTGNPQTTNLPSNNPQVSAEQPASNSTSPSIPENASASPEILSASSYREYLGTMQASSSPQDVVNLQSVSVYDGDGLLRRSAAYESKMTWLNENTPQYVTPAAYAAFTDNGIDKSLAGENIFAPELPGTKLSSLECYTMHWTAGITDDPKRAAEMMLARERTANVQLMTMQDGVPYLITETLDTKAFHAGAANNTCVGNEIVGNDLLDFTPQQTLSNIFLTVYLHREFGMPLFRDIDKIEGQPRNQYGDYTPLDYGDDLSGPIGHVEVPDSHKLDPTVMYVNFVYEQAVLLNNMLDGQSTTTETLPEHPMQSTGNTIQTLSYINDNTTPTLGGLSIAYLLSQPVLTADQAELVDRSEASGFTAPQTAIPTNSGGTTVNQPVAPPASPETVTTNAQALLSPQAQNYIPVPAAIALERSKNSRMNGGDLSFEEAYGQPLAVTDIYIYLRSAGANHTEALTLTAVAMRETGLRPASVGDLTAHDGVVMPSYGLFQIRDLGDGNEQRNPEANLNPMLAAQNAYAIYLQSGLKPWESTLPAELTEDAVYEAVRLPNRDLPASDRQRVNERARVIARQVITEVNAIQPSVEVAMGVLV